MELVQNGNSWPFLNIGYENCNLHSIQKATFSRAKSTKNKMNWYAVQKVLKVRPCASHKPHFLHYALWQIYMYVQAYNTVPQYTFPNTLSSPSWYRLSHTCFLVLNLFPQRLKERPFGGGEVRSPFGRMYNKGSPFRMGATQCYTTILFSTSPFWPLKDPSGASKLLFFLSIWPGVFFQLDKSCDNCEHFPHI